MRQVFLQYFYWMFFPVICCATTNLLQKEAVTVTCAHKEIRDFSSLLTAANKKQVVADSKCYQVIVRNVTEGKKFYMFMQSLLKKDFFGTYYVHEGQLFREGAPPAPDSYILSNYVKGERFTLFLKAVTGDMFLETTIVPSPLECVGKDGATVSMYVLDKQAKAFEFVGTGFQPYESLCVVHTIFTDPESNWLRLSENGEFSVTVYVIEQGIMGGKAFLSVLRNGELLEMQFPWGLALVNNKQPCQEK